MVSFLQCFFQANSQPERIIIINSLNSKLTYYKKQQYIWFTNRKLQARLNKGMKLNKISKLAIPIVEIIQNELTNNNLLCHLHLTFTFHYIQLN